MAPDLVDEPPAENGRLPGFGIRRRKNKLSRSAVLEKQPEQEAGDKSYVDSLIGAAMRPSQGSKTHNWSISTIDSHFRYFSIWVFCTYFTLVATVYVVVPAESIVRLDGVEKNSAIMAMSLIAISFVSRIVPLLGGVGGGRMQKVIGERNSTSVGYSLAG